MKVAAALGLLEALWAAGQELHIPGWVSVSAFVAVAGVYLRFREQKFEKRLQESTAAKTDVDTRALEEDLQRRLAERTRTAYLEMESQLKEMQVRLSAATQRASDLEREMARLTLERNEKERILRSAIEKLHDRVAAAESGTLADKRRLDPEP